MNTKRTLGHLMDGQTLLLVWRWKARHVVPKALTQMLSIAIVKPDATHVPGAATAYFFGFVVLPRELPSGCRTATCHIDYGPVVGACNLMMLNLLIVICWVWTGSDRPPSIVLQRTLSFRGLHRGFRRLPVVSRASTFTDLGYPAWVHY
jgi:hypothetical protein